MRKDFALLAAVLFSGSIAVAAQSGRRVPPAPTVERPIEIPILSSPATGESRAPREAMAAVTSVPDDVWNQELRDLKRARFRLADYRDKVVVVNLWATWCGPCRSELPELENLSKEYAAHGVQFIGLTTENPEMDAAKVEKFVRDAKLTYRIGWLDRQSAGALTRGRNLIPQTFVITGDGQVVGHLVGYNSSRSERLLRAAVKRALKENAADEQ